QGSRDVSEIYSQFSDSVEVLYNSDINRLQAFLSERLNYYDIIWVTRTHNLTRIMPILEVVGILRHKIKLILDTEAISATRQAARYSLEAPEPMFNMDAALVRELSFIDHCHEVLTVSKIEANLLKRAGVANVSVLGTMKPPSPTSTGFSERRDLLFVASIHDEDSPTLDALHWFRSKIAPALAEYFEVQPILNFVGYIAPDIDLSAFSGDPNIRIHGAVADLRPYYEVCRVFIAPTRFAAGTPYKIYETASFGLPSVVTDLLATQLGWQNGDEVLSAPVAAPAVFARRIAELYNDEILWTKIRNASLRRLQVENTQEAFVDALKAVIDRVCGAKSLGSGKGRPSRKPVAVR
ncbi:MAG TPA: glycosyltransferase, partial [Acidocella sp.]|nr:glycosyltransferase [Acidocella sp.]